MSVFSSPFKEPFRNPFGSPFNGPGVGGVNVAEILAALQSQLTDAGIWSKLDALYVATSNAPTSALVNLKNPGTYNLTASGGPTLAAAGYSGDATDAYLATGYTPTGSGAYKLNDASAGCWVTAQPVSSASDYVLGAAATENLRIAARTNTTNGSTTRLNNGGTNNVYTVRAEGLTALRRNNSGNYQVFKGGILAGTATVASTALPGAITLLRTAAVYSPSTTSACAWWIGGSLTDAEMMAFYEALSRCLLALGVITQSEFAFPGGATTWFNEPRSLAVGSTLLLGAVAVDGTVVVNTVAPDEPGLQVMLYPKLQRDDHDNPALLRRASDGKILAMYARHSTDNNFYVSLSTNADSALAWGAATDIGTALGAINYGYAQPVQLTDEVGDPIHLFGRCETGGFNDTLHHAVLDESGAVTSAYVRVLSGFRPYFKVEQNGNARVDIWCNDGHPSEAATNSLYHFYYEGGAYYTSAGVLLGALPLTPSTSLTRIWDGSTAAGRSWVWDGRLVEGVPSVAYAVFPSTTDHRYRLASWNGSAWVDEEVCAAGSYLYAGQPYYSGGIALDPDNADTVYCCRQVDGAGAISTSGVHQVFKYIKTGGTWTGTQLTFGTDPCLRPYVIPGTRKLQYCTGRYTLFTDYDTRIVVVDIA